MGRLPHGLASTMRWVKRPLRYNWTDKIARKMQASKEVWGKIFGTIDTREKFLDRRLELALHEWARLKRQRFARMPQLPQYRLDGRHAAVAARSGRASALPVHG